MSSKDQALQVFLAISVAVWVATCLTIETQSSVERKSIDGLPTITGTQSGKSRAKVESIDYASRTITLTGPSSKTETFFATPAVRNFGQIKKGDMVGVEYASRIFASV